MEAVKRTRKIRKGSQSNAILEYLKDGNEISRKDAYIMFGCMTLAQRIRDLKDAGYKIKTDYINVDKQTQIAKYSLEV